MPSAFLTLLKSTLLHEGHDRLPWEASTSEASADRRDPIGQRPLLGRWQPSAAAATTTAAAADLPPSPPRPFLACAPAEAGAGWQAVVAGPALQCFEAATLGMPLEVWKTYLGRNRGVTTLGAVREIYGQGGLPAFWAGTSAKLVESASKGLVLMWAKESLLNAIGDSFSPGKRQNEGGGGGGGD